jgi:DNA mismatch repair protein MutS2
MIDTGQIQVENLVAGLQAERKRSEEIVAEAETERKAARQLREDLVHRLRAIEEERREILRRARRDAEVELADLRAQLRQAAASLQRQDQGRGELVAAVQAVEAAGRQVLTKPLPGVVPGNLPRVQAPSGTGPWEVGDSVRVTSLSQEGRITSLGADGDGVEVQLGNFKLRTSRDDVEWLSRSASDSTASPSTYAGPSIWNSSQRSVPGLQLDLRGWRAEQVGPELDQYLNDAYMSGLPNVRIVHGKGTGVLRQVVHEHLRKTRLVDRFEIAEARDGGDGATVAWLAL